MWKRTFLISTSGLVVLLLASLTITKAVASSLRPADCGSETKSSDFQICEPPPCTEDQINTLWPTEDRNFFYQCAPKSRCSWYPVRMPCAPGTVFGFKEQVCIWECDWVDPCNGNVTTTTTTSSSSSTTPTTTERVTSSTSEITTSTQQTTTSTETEPPICEIPSCTDDEVHKLWPVQGYPESYYQCHANPKGKCEWMVVQKLCENGYYFDYHQQACVSPEKWRDVCSIESTTTEGATTESTTVISTTETTQVTTEEVTSTTEQSTITSTNEVTSTDASTTTTTSGAECPVPDCDNKSQRHLLWAVTDSPQSFYQCEPAEGSECQFNLVLKQCPENKWFNGKLQDCVDEEYWVDSCSQQTTGAETTTEIPTTTNAATSTTEPNFELCEKPECSAGQTDTLWPHPDPQKYYQCQPIPGEGFEVEIVDCENDLYFSFENQFCVPFSDWKNVCPSFSTTDFPTTEVSTTEPSTTEISTTEPSTTEISTTEPSTTEISTTELSTTEISTTDISTTDVSTTESSTTEISTTEFSTTEISTTDISTTEFSTTDQSTTEITTEISTTDASTTETSTSEASTTTTERTTDGPGEITSNVQTSPSTPPGFQLCDTPECSDEQREKLWPNRNPSVYYRCVPTGNGEWAAQTLNCLRGLYFDFEKQQCVSPSEWKDVCPASQGENQKYCIEPECKTDSGKNKLWPHPDRAYFYQCAPSKECGFAPVKMPCAKGLVFSYQQQVCVEPCNWIDPCTNSTTPSPVATSTAKTTAKPTTRVTVTTKPPLTTKKPTNRPSSVTTRSTTTKKVTSLKPTYRPTTIKPKPTYRPTTKPTSTTTTRSTTMTHKPSPSTASPSGGNQPGETCIPPKCDTDYERLRLYPHPNKNFYYQCAPDANKVPEYSPVKRPCGPGTAFSWRYQVCVHERDWEDPCESAQNEISNLEPQIGSGKRGPMYLPPRFK